MHMPFVAAFLLPLVCGEPAQTTSAPSVDTRPRSVQQDVESVKRATTSFAAMLSDTGSEPLGGRLQTYLRLKYLRKREYSDTERLIWRGLTIDVGASMYARLCAAYFLVGTDPTARAFLEAQLQSTNISHRYNAAQVLLMYAQDYPPAEWCTPLLVSALASGSVDPSGVTQARIGGPEEDEGDILCTPIDDICWYLGWRKERSAVDALIGVLRRHPSTHGAAFALSEIGDSKAIPMLMTVLRSRAGYQDQVATALAKFKCVEAVPVMAEYLGTSREGASGIDKFETEAYLEALATIGDPRAVPAIEAFLTSYRSADFKTAAKRALIQLTSSEPIPDLIALFEAEEVEYEKAAVIRTLAEYPDARVVRYLSRLARESDSAFIRRVAMEVLGDVGTREAMLELADLLAVQFPKTLKADWGWRSSPDDFSVYFPNFIRQELRRETKQDFGTDAKAWSAWILDHWRDPEPASRPITESRPAASAPGSR